MSQTRSTVRPIIAVLYVTLSTFTQKDIDVFSARYRTEKVKCKSFIDMLSSMWKVVRVNCVFCWFGSLRFLPAVLIARLLRKKVIVLSGGYDVASVKALRYGNMYGTISRYMGRMLFKMAHLVPCISNSNKTEAIKNALVPHNKIRMIYLGFYQPETDTGTHSIKKEKIVVTVGIADSCTIYRKGLLATAKLSKLLPDIPFIFAGKADPEALKLLKKNAGSNCIFTGYLEDSELVDLLARAKVYIQMSIHEAFGCSVAEAMLHNCIPVVSNQFALPEVVGKAGFCADRHDLVAVAETLKQVLNDSIKPAENPRERILREFPISRRASQLAEMIDDLCSK